MSLHQHLADTGGRFDSRVRFAQPAGLAPPSSASAGQHVRCACDRCGSHLLAVTRPSGHLDGTCAVCLSRAVTPVEDRSPAA
jgi:hypothetical protein